VENATKVALDTNLIQVRAARIAAIHRFGSHLRVTFDRYLSEGVLLSSDGAMCLDPLQPARRSIGLGETKS
jgi:hypothetical protein